MHIGFGRGSQKEIYHWDDLDLGEWIILKWIIREIGLGDMDWIDLARDRDQWMALVNTIRNLQI
jgi:hypothetical protein